MPIYTYRCETCVKEFDILQKMSDEELTKYPECNKNCDLKKIPSSCGIRFNGSGFYVNDYRKK